MRGRHDVLPLVPQLGMYHVQREPQCGRTRLVAERGPRHGYRQRAMICGDDRIKRNVARLPAITSDKHPVVRASAASIVNAAERDEVARSERYGCDEPVVFFAR